MLYVLRKERSFTTFEVMASLDEVNIARHLLTLGCCERCSLRLLDNVVNDAINFANIEEEFAIGPSSLACKKVKPNPCIICFDILRDEGLGKLFEPAIIEKIKQYDTDTFKINLTVPDCIIIREFRVVKYIKEKFPDYKSDFGLTHKINRMSMAYRLSIQKKLEELTGKKYETNSLLYFDVIFSHKDDLKENQKFLQLDRRSYPRQYDNTKQKLIGRRNMLKTLTNIPDAELKSIYPTFPSIPNGRATLSSIQVHRLMLNVGGRFMKYDKHLSVCEADNRNRSDSLDMLLKNFLAKKFKTGPNQIKFNFISYLQDEYTVLGTGMPFFCRITDAKEAEFSFSKARESEIEFNKLHAKYGVAVRDLQIVERDTTNQLIHYSNFSHRRCVIICSVPEANRLPKVLNTLNNLTLPLQIKGATTNSQVAFLLRVIASRTTDSSSFFGLDIVGSPGLDLDGFLRQTTYPSLVQLAGTRFNIECVNLVEDYLNWPPMVTPDVESLRSRYCVPFYSWEASTLTETEQNCRVRNDIAVSSDTFTSFQTRNTNIYRTSNSVNGNDENARRITKNHVHVSADSTMNVNIPRIKEDFDVKDIIENHVSYSVNGNDENAHRITKNHVHVREDSTMNVNIPRIKEDFDVKDIIDPHISDTVTKMNMTTSESIGRVCESLGDTSQNCTKYIQNLTEIKQEDEVDIIDKHIKNATMKINMSEVEYNGLLQALKKSIVEELRTSGCLSVTKLTKNTSEVRKTKTTGS